MTGDLAHWGEQAAYASLAGVLAGFDAPTILMMGNHDKRDAFRPLVRRAPTATPTASCRACTSFDAATVVTLDTLNEDTPDHAGILCEARLRFLDEALGLRAGRPAATAVPAPSAVRQRLRYMDTIKLANRRGRMGRDRPHAKARLHVHGPSAPADRRHLARHTVPYPARADPSGRLRFRDEGHIPGTHELPDYSLVTVGAGKIVIHQCSFLYDGPLFSLQDRAALEWINR